MKHKMISILLSTFLCLSSLPCKTFAQDIQACDPTETCTEENVENNDKMIEISMDEAITFFTDKKSGILYFGFENCPWCQQARPILKKAAKNTPIYYVKVRDENENLLYTDTQREKLATYIGQYMSENPKEQNALWLYVPLVIHVEDGQAIDGHQGTVKNHNAKKRKMTKKEKKKLKKRYQMLIKKKTSDVK